MIARQILLILSIVLIAISASANDQELVVKDTGGFTRASSAVDGAGNVEFSLVDDAGLAAEGVEVTLTNAVSGEQLTAISAGGVVLFEGVGAGVWTVASVAPGVTFTNVAVLSSAAIVAAGGVGTAAAVGVGAAAIGGTALAVSASSSSDDDDSISPSS